MNGRIIQIRCVLKIGERNEKLLTNSDKFVKMFLHLEGVVPTLLKVCFRSTS